MRVTFIFIACIALAVACSSGGNGTADASGGAGTTGAAGATFLTCAGKPDECCDLPQAAAGCASTLEAELGPAPPCLLGGDVKRTDQACGDYRFIGFACLPAKTCVYDGAGQLVAWQRCDDTFGPCGDPCKHGGRHADGGVTTFFTAEAPATCPPAP
jgi:hypothetical protein